MTHSRKGFALAAVLWSIVIASTLTAAAALKGREEFGAARNRRNATVATWRASGCAALILAGTDEALHTLSDAKRIRIWRKIDLLVDSLANEAGSQCEAEARAIGSAVDVNAASEEMIEKFFRLADSVNGSALTAALLDWRDQDDDARPGGAERDWYQNHEMLSPRNDSIAADGELAHVAGLENRPDLRRYLTTLASPVCLAAAPAQVLGALPGSTTEAVERVLADRAEDRAIIDLRDVAARISPAAAESLIVHFTELSLGTTPEPRTWLLRVSAREGFPATTATIELWLDLFGNHVRVTRRTIL